MSPGIRHTEFQPLSGRHRAYAEEAIAYDRTIGSPAFIAFVLSQIVDKVVMSGKSAPLIEYGFYQRLAQTAFCGALN